LNSVTESLVKNSNVNNGEDISLSTKDWRLIDWTPKTFSQFYNENCGAGERCILRFSVINPLKWEKSNIPFLEWQIKIDPPNSSIPLRYSRIVSTWKAYWFSKTLEIRVPQDTIPEALDFTVFQ
jgi:hypothetical protein